MWIYLGIISAVLLGLYDVSRKHSLRANAVLPVLFVSTVFGSLLLGLDVGLSRLIPQAMMRYGLYVAPIGWTAHLLLFIKAVTVAALWVLSYFAIKHLPISVFSGIVASSPVWTLAGAILLFHESPTPLQWAGLVVIILSYYAFSIAGCREGIVFHRNKWVILAFLATLLGSCSGLYDKFLIQSLGYTPLAVQAWCMLYLMPVLGMVVLVFWLPGRSQYTPFSWRWTIPLVGVLLAVSDFAYFRALGYKDALIILLSVLRCSYVAISFSAGAVIFREVNIRSKVIALAGILAGVFLILLHA